MQQVQSDQQAQKKGSQDKGSQDKGGAAEVLVKEDQISRGSRIVEDVEPASPLGGHPPGDDPVAS